LPYRLDVGSAGKGGQQRVRKEGKCSDMAERSSFPGCERPFST
jgi:hypothetical protein